MPKLKKSFRIVLTGGPGGGKSTVAEKFYRINPSESILVPESATLVFKGGFPHDRRAQVRRHCQRAIFHLQKNLEDALFITSEKRVILCDRGTLDGLAYWPGSLTNFLKEMNCHIKTELLRYDAVIFLETCARGGISIRGGNPHRNESIQEAIVLDTRLKKIWSKHPQFHFIAHERSFQKRDSDNARNPPANSEKLTRVCAQIYGRITIR